MKPASATYTAECDIYHADTCQPLLQASRRGEVRLESLARGSYPGRRLPENDLQEVCTLGFWDAPREQSWGLDWHRNEGIEFTYLAGGKTAFAVEDRNYRLQPGDFTVTRPWQRHRVGAPNVGPSRLHWLILDVGVRRPNQPWQWPQWILMPSPDLRRLTRLLSHNEQPVWRGSSEIGACFEQIASLVGASKKIPDPTRIKILINQLLIAAAELLESRKIKLDQSLSSSRRSVDLFLRELPARAAESWTLERMSQQCGLAQTRFAWYCKQLTNMSPVEYLAHCRIKAAAALLIKERRMSITDVALACGFQTSQYFATVFRQQTHRTPREFRARAN